MSNDLTPVEYLIYDSKDDAIRDGWPDAQYGTWYISNLRTKTRQGWIALERKVNKPTRRYEDAVPDVVEREEPKSERPWWYGELIP